MSKLKIVSIAVFLALLAPAMLSASQAELREKARSLQNEGNFREAYDIYARLSTDPAGRGEEVAGDFSQAILCLKQLNRIDEIDTFRETVIAIHSSNPRLLRQAGLTFLDGTHYGYIIAGEFHRGPHRGGGDWVDSYRRDRTAALQLLVRAKDLFSPITGAERRKAAQLMLDLARALLGRTGYAEAWRLQYKTDLTSLPDYDRGRYYRFRWRGPGAPVDEA
ncbi:MAG: hypothetical protein J7M14_07530, partial [Planctomycetes bacterium]|nr:hypothetical protein [Planctomycetota bacterium]